MEITATVLLCSPHGNEAQALTRVFGTMPKGLSELVDWLSSQRVTAVVLEGTGVYWLAPHDALSDAGIEPRLVHAQHAKQLNEKDGCLGHSPDLRSTSRTSRPGMVCIFLTSRFIRFI